MIVTQKITKSQQSKKTQSMGPNGSNFLEKYTCRFMETNMR